VFCSAAAALTPGCIGRSPCPLNRVNNQAPTLFSPRPISETKVPRLFSCAWSDLASIYIWPLSSSHADTRPVSPATRPSRSPQHAQSITGFRKDQDPKQENKTRKEEKPPIKCLKAPWLVPQETPETASHSPPRPLWQLRRPTQARIRRRASFQRLSANCRMPYWPLLKSVSEHMLVIKCALCGPMAY
jgi:hypothetical protein